MELKLITSQAESNTIPLSSNDSSLEKSQLHMSGIITPCESEIDFFFVLETAPGISCVGGRFPAELRLLYQLSHDIDSHI